MDTNSNNQPEKKSWTHLIQQAKSAQPPESPDLLKRLQYAIENEPTKTETKDGDTTNWLDEITGLFEIFWLKPAFAALSLIIISLGLHATREWNEFAVVWELQIPGLTSIL